MWKLAIGLVVAALVVWIVTASLVPEQPAAVDGAAVASEVSAPASIGGGGASASARAPVADEGAAAPVSPEVAGAGRLVTGTVFDGDGAPFAGALVFDGSHAEVAIGERLDSYERRPFVATDDRGRFEFAFEVEGPRVLVARAEGWAPSDEAEVTIDADAPVEVDLHLRHGGAVCGTIFGIDGGPVAGRLVQVASADLGEFRTARTDGDGSFALDALNPGPWRAASYPDDGELAAAGEPLGIESSMSFLAQFEFRLEDREHLEFDLGRVAADSPRVTGRTTVRGEPVAGVMQWFPRERPMERAMKRADRDGSYAIDLPQPGAWIVHANALGANSNGRVLAVELGAGEVRELDIDLDGFDLDGRVVDGEGQPIAGVAVQLIVVAGQPHFPVPTLGGGTEVTDGDGRYRFEFLAPGDYAVVAHGGSAEDDRAPTAATVSATIPLGRSTTAADLVVGAGASVAIEVRRADGRPVPRASLWFHTADGACLNPLTSTNSDDRGRAVSPGLPLGPVWVTAGHRDGASESAQVTVGVDGEVRLTLGPAHWLELARTGGAVDATAERTELVDEQGRQWASLVDTRRLFDARPDRSNPERPLYGPLPPGVYRARVSRPGATPEIGRVALDAAGVTTLTVARP